jgi:transcriptional regulator with XRE-family HTH domain
MVLERIDRPFFRESRPLMNLSRKIRDFRYAKGWGPDELASRAKISRTALYQIERGSTSKPQAGTLRRISRALGVPLEVLLTAAPVPNEGAATTPANPANSTAAPSSASLRLPSSERAEELIEKFRLLLSSPLAEGVARIVEESFRLLPIVPPPGFNEPSRFASLIEIESTRQGRGRSSTPA